MIPISLCLITKNEADKLRKCLSAAASLPFEIVVVDTGSTDDSVAVAKEFTDHVYHFDWIKDFSAARNFSISKASNDWILVLDTDEYVTDADMDEIYRLIEAHPDEIGRIKRTSADDSGLKTVDYVERLFDRRIYMYKRPIHEQVLPIDETNVTFTYYPIPLSVDHDGYLSVNGENQKAQRNLEILLASEKDFPDSYTYFQIGASYHFLGDYKKACTYFEKGLDYDLSPDSEYVQMMIIQYGYCLMDDDRLEDALTFYEQIYPYFDFLADIVLCMGTIYLRHKDYMKAAMQFVKATTTERYFTLGANSFIAYYHLGVVNELLGQKEQAVTFYQLSGDYPPAVERLQAIK